MELRIPSKNIRISSHRYKFDLSKIWRELQLPNCKRPYYWTTKEANRLRERGIVKVCPLKQVDKSYSLPKRNRTTYASMEGVYEYLSWIDNRLYLEALQYSRD